MQLDVDTLDTAIKIVGGILGLAVTAGSFWMTMIYKRIDSIDRHIKAFLVLQGSTEARLKAHDKRLDRLEEKIF